MDAFKLMTKSLQKFDFGFASLFAVMLIIAAGNTALQSVLPTIGRTIKIPDIYIALVFSLSALFWTASAPYWARQSDLRGRKALVKLGLIGFIISTSFAAFALLSGLRGWIGPMMTFAAFITARSIFGLFGSAANPAAQAYVAARSSDAQRTVAISTLSSAFGLGTILGPALAPLFVLPFVGLSGPVFVMAAIAALILIGVNKYLEEDAPDLTAPPPPRQKMAWRDPRIAPFMIIGLVLGHVQAAIGQTLAFHLIDLLQVSPKEALPFITVAMMAGAGATLVAQWGLIRMVEMTPRQLVLIGTGMATLGSMGLALAADYGLAVSSFALLCFGFGLARPGFTEGASLVVGPEEQGGVAGVVTAMNGSCYILAPFLGVALYKLWSPSVYVVSFALLLTLLLYARRNPALRAADTGAVHEPPLD
jgi:MFS family permease